MGAQAEQAEGFLEEVPPPTGPEGQAQPEELVEPPHSGSGRRPILGAPAGPTHVLAEGVGAARWAQADSQLRGRMRVGKATATVRPHLRAVFLTLTLPRQQTEAPLEFTKTNAPTVGSARARQSCPGRRTPARPPESHVTLLFREAPERTLFWVPKALMSPEAPHQGSKLARAPKSPREGGQCVYRSATATPPPRANGSLAAKRVRCGLRSQTPCPGCRPAPLSRLMAAQPRPPKGAGHWPAWAAGAASRGAWGGSLGLQACTWGLIPTLTRWLRRQQLGGSGRVRASTPQQPPSPTALGGGSPWARGPESGQTTASPPPPTPEGLGRVDQGLRPPAA